ncbi:MAG: hypothetical protein JXQ72_00455 [Anaerolineae bacterium]|nr:hypothetical protein [Anaerolineae bacterium]
MPSQADLRRQLRAATDPADQCRLALDLLAATRSREHVDSALNALKRESVIVWLDHSHRPALRDKALYYFEHDDRDRGGLVRESIIRLLAHIGHPADTDLYIRATGIYHRHPTTDTAQNLRAAALEALNGVDGSLACAYAAHLLGEPDTSDINSEPSFTAINVLAQWGRLLPVAVFLRLAGRQFISKGLGELVGRALEVLGGDDFPRALYGEIAAEFAALDVPVVCMGIVSAIVEGRITDHYGLLRDLLHRTKHGELHRYGLILLAGSRDDTLITLLYDLIRECPDRWRSHCREAVALTPESADRDRVLAELDNR